MQLMANIKAELFPGRGHAFSIFGFFLSGAKTRLILLQPANSEVQQVSQ